MSLTKCINLVNIEINQVENISVLIKKRKILQKITTELVDIDTRNKRTKFNLN